MRGYCEDAHRLFVSRFLEKKKQKRGPGPSQFQGLIIIIEKKSVAVLVSEKTEMGERVAAAAADQAKDDSLPSSSLKSHMPRQRARHR